MKKIILISLVLLMFLGCTSKELKKYGGNLALNGGGGNPIVAGAGLVVGGTIYGIGSLVDNDEVKKDKEVKENNNDE